MTKAQRYRQAFLAIHGRSERNLATNIRKAIRKDINSLFLGTINDKNYNDVLQNLELKELEQTLIDFYIKTGTITGEMATRNIERQLKRNSPFFSEIWTNFVLRTFAPIVATKIVSIKQTLIGDISKLITEYIALNLDIVDIAGAITDFVNEPTFYKWQGMRIARTETTIAMNTATNLAGQESGVALDKEWISAGDGNERESHAEMSGVRVDQNDLFPNGLMYPGDENGEASEVINCRCTFLQVPKRDGDGNIILTI